jgi:ribosomal protein S18 acetylase RimI-like enzyme
MRATSDASFDAPDLKIRDVASENAITTLARLRTIEKKSFPANEAFDFNVGLLGKQNTKILYTTLQSDLEDTPVAYAVYVRWRSVVLLQKLCVMGSFRGRRIGKIMLLEVMSRAQNARCSAIELWVDESRTIARGLYSSCGFKDVQHVQDYYGPRRHGIKMRFDLPV